MQDSVFGQMDGVANENDICAGVTLYRSGDSLAGDDVSLERHAEDYITLIYPYSYIAKALKNAAISYFKDPAKLSCCAE